MMIPGSPRPSSQEQDDGVYRSIFQQPQLEIPPTAPPYAWFEFLLHPAALQTHLETLRHQNARGLHSATSAMELVREFLDQAQLVADDGHIRNQRYRALCLLAAQVALQMDIPLPEIERHLPPHFQRLLLDGMVDFVTSEVQTEYTQDLATLSRTHAQLLHDRWALRMLVHEKQNGYLTSTNKHDAEEQMNGFHIALVDLLEHHGEIAQRLENMVQDESITKQNQFDALYDLAVYYFTFQAYEKSYRYFAHASELLTPDKSLNIEPNMQARLKGYLDASQAFVKLNEKRVSIDQQIDTAMSSESYETVVDLLEKESLANPLEKCSPGYRDALERRVLMLLHTSSQAHTVRWLYKRIAVGNILNQSVDTTQMVCSLVRLLREEVSMSNSLFTQLFTYLNKTSHLMIEKGLPQSATVQVALDRVKAHFSPLDALEALQDMEKRLEQQGIVQQEYFHVLHNMFSLDQETIHSIVCALERMETTQWQQLSSSQAYNLITFLAIHGGWHLLSQWCKVENVSPPIRSSIHFVVACGNVMQYFNGPDFVMTRCNHLVHEILGHRQALEDEEKILCITPVCVLESLVCVCAGLLHRAVVRSVGDYRVSFDLTPYGDVALKVVFAPEPSKKQYDADQEMTEDTISTIQLLKTWLPDLITLHARVLQALLQRCPREPRWHCAIGDLALYPIVRIKQPSSLSTDPHTAIREYLVAASLATNHFSDIGSVVDIIDQSSLVRLSQCLVKTGAHVAAAVLYQCFTQEEFKYGLRILQLAPESHDPVHFQYFWQLPFLELLVHLHSTLKHYNNRYVKLITHLIQSPELNTSNALHVHKELEQRILRCYFRDLCQTYLS